MKTYKTLDLNNHEANQTDIKNVIKLKDGKVLVILSNYFNEYVFYYFDENSDFLYKKSFNLVRGIRSIKEFDNGDFVCTSLVIDNSSFQFYRLDTSGNIKWIRTPYNGFGSASAVLIENNKIYIAGGVNGIGVFLICDIDGIILKEFRYDTFYCQQRFCSTYMDADNSLVIGGYVQHCQSSDSSGSDVAILKIDTNGTILWNKLYDFRNSLGTSGQGGYYTDYGGFVIAKTNDGGVITNGMSRYSRSSPGGVMHEDALLIKTEPLVITNTDKKNNKGHIQFQLSANLVRNNLNIIGQFGLIKHWVIYSLQGDIILQGKGWSEPVNIGNIESGMHAIEIVDQNNYQYFFKFVKI